VYVNMTHLLTWSPSGDTHYVKHWWLL